MSRNREEKGSERKNVSKKKLVEEGRKRPGKRLCLAEWKIHQVLNKKRGRWRRMHKKGVALRGEKKGVHG